MENRSVKDDEKANKTILAAGECLLLGNIYRKQRAMLIEFLTERKPFQIDQFECRLEQFTIRFLKFFLFFYQSLFFKQAILLLFNQTNIQWIYDAASKYSSFEYVTSNSLDVVLSDYTLYSYFDFLISFLTFV